MSRYCLRIGILCIWLGFIASKSHACTQMPPIPIMWPHNTTVYQCVGGEALYFYDDGSYDPDDDPPGQTGSQAAQDAITDWSWCIYDYVYEDYYEWDYGYPYTNVGSHFRFIRFQRTS